MTQPILNSNVVTSIDHKAGSSPVLGQIPEHTQDELKALSHERWAGVCLPSNEALNNFGYHIAMGLSALNDVTSEDRIAVMKLADGLLLPQKINVTTQKITLMVLRKSYESSWIEYMTVVI